MSRKMLKKKEKTPTEKKEIEFGVNLRLTNKKQEYIRNKINGNYFLARCNMIAGQLQSKKIEENIDGMTKSFEYLRAEYGLIKMQAIMSMRTAFFSRKELLEEFKLTEKDVEAVEKDYYDGNIIRDDYDDAYRRKTKAEFVDTSKD